MSDDPRPSATQVLADLRAGRTDARQLVERLDEAVRAAAPLGAVLAWDVERARDVAGRLDADPPPGPLSRLPLLVKDTIDTAELPTTAGTPALEGRVPREDAPTVARAVAAGGWVAAKTAVHELSFGITSNNAATGPVRNPYDRDRVAGGSSGGAAAAVAAGLAPLGLAADTGGSSRLPAAHCGVVGLRPTQGRYPTGGTVPVSATRDTVGVVGRTVGDVALLDRVLAGPDGDGPPPGVAVSAVGLRLGLPGRLWEDLDPALGRVARDGLAALVDAGIETVEVDLSETLALAQEAGFPLVFGEYLPELAEYLEHHGYGLTVDDVVAGVRSPDVREVLAAMRGPAAVDAAALQAARETRTRAQRAYAAALEGAGVAAVLFPTTPLPASPVGDDVTTELNDRQVPTFETFIRHTDLAGVAGHPGISVPAGLTDGGLPVGLELDGAVGDDEALLRTAAAVVAVLPPTPPPPGLVGEPGGGGGG